MSNLSPNKTDKFFRQALKSSPELFPTEKDWNDMERLLKGKPNKRPVIGWIYWPAGIAAGLLIFLSVWLSREPEIQLVDGEKSKNSTIENQTENSSLNTQNESAIPNALVPVPAIPDQGGNSSLSTAILKQESSRTAEDFIESALFTNSNSEDINQFKPLNKALFQGLENINPLPFEDFTSINTFSLKPEKSPLIDSISRKLESSNEKPVGRLTLSMAFTTDMNTVNALTKSKAGLSYGIGLNYKISKILSAGTGIYLSQKQYTSDRYSYHTTEKPFSTWASYSKQIDAFCNVIDIPLNLSVLMSKTKKTGIVASAGLSSYIMLTEKYNFVYNPTPSYPSSGRTYTIKNENQHILSVVNLSVGVEKPLGKQSSIVIQPYAKLPLSGIGQGETELKSFGVGFQLNYSMKKKNKFFNRKLE